MSVITSFRAFLTGAALFAASAVGANQDIIDTAKSAGKFNTLISAIDAKKNLLTLEEQKRKLAQLESDIKSRKEQAEAQLAVLREQRNKAMIDVRREEQRIAQAKVLSPMAGLVAIKQNRSGYFNFGQSVPDIREGDTLQPGMPVADVLDLSELEVVAKVGELDRANLHEGQDALLQLLPMIAERSAYPFTTWGITAFWFPWWVLVLILGREAFMTWFRTFAQARGVVGDPLRVVPRGVGDEAPRPFLG